MNKYDGSGYTGAGYVGQQEELIVRSLDQPDTRLTEFQQLQTRWVPSMTVFESSQLVNVLNKWNNYNQLLIKSWDLKPIEGIGGTIARFEHSRTRERSDDFKFTMRRRGFDKLKPNMDYLREEVDVAISQLDIYAVGGVERWTGTTPDGDYQIILTRCGSRWQWGWIALADQIFIPLINNWTETTGRNPSLDTKQSTQLRMNIQQAIEYQRQQEKSNG